MNVKSLNLLPQVKELYREAKYREALELIELIEREDEIDDIVQIEVQILKCRINIDDENYTKENLRLAENALEKSRNLIVLCSYHHGLVHRQLMVIDLIGNPMRIQVRYRTKYFELQPN